MDQNPAAANHDARQLLRQRLRQLRSGIPIELRREHDLAISQRIELLVEATGARKIACYWPFNGEPDLRPLCRKLLADGVEVALPVIEICARDPEGRPRWRRTATS